MKSSVKTLTGGYYLTNSVLLTVNSKLPPVSSNFHTKQITEGYISNGNIT